MTAHFAQARGSHECTPFLRIYSIINEKATIKLTIRGMVHPGWEGHYRSGKKKPTRRLLPA